MSEKKAKHKKASVKRHSWTEKELEKFLELTDEKTDMELASIFKVGRPSVQFIRRKVNLARKVTTNKKKQLELIGSSEHILRKQAIESVGKKKVRERTTAPKARA